jgi:hypothetical protein
MKKNNHQVIPSKFLPLGSKRITNANNERVWLINGKEFISKAEYFQYLKDQALASKDAMPKANTPAAPELAAVEAQ